MSSWRSFSAPALPRAFANAIPLFLLILFLHIGFSCSSHVEEFESLIASEIVKIPAEEFETDAIVVQAVDTVSSISTYRDKERGSKSKGLYFHHEDDTDKSIIVFSAEDHFNIPDSSRLRYLYLRQTSVPNEYFAGFVYIREALWKDSPKFPAAGTNVTLEYDQFDFRDDPADVTKYMGWTECRATIFIPCKSSDTANLKELSNYNPNTSTDASPPNILIPPVAAASKIDVFLLPEMEIKLFSSLFYHDLEDDSMKTTSSESANVKILLGFSANDSGIIMDYVDKSTDAEVLLEVEEPAPGKIQSYVTTSEGKVEGRKAIFININNNIKAEKGKLPRKRGGVGSEESSVEVIVDNVKKGLGSDLVVELEEESSAESSISKIATAKAPIGGDNIIIINITDNFIVGKEDEGSKDESGGKSSEEDLDRSGEVGGHSTETPSDEERPLLRKRPCNDQNFLGAVVTWIGRGEPCPTLPDDYYPPQVRSLQGAEDTFNIVDYIDHPGWKPIFDSLKENITLQTEDVPYIGFGYCPNHPESPETLVNATTGYSASRFFLNVLRLGCLTDEMDSLDYYILDKNCLVLRDDHSLEVPTSCDWLKKQKLKLPDQHSLSRAFELAAFSQAYVTEMKSLDPLKPTLSPGKKQISRSTYLLSKMAFRIITEVWHRARHHVVKLTRNLIKTLKTSFLKSIQDFVEIHRRCGADYECSIDFQVNEEDRLFLLVLIEFVIHGAVSFERHPEELFQAFYTKNKESIRERLMDYYVH